MSENKGCGKIIDEKHYCGYCDVCCELHLCLDCQKKKENQSQQETQEKGENPISLVSELDNVEYVKKDLSKHNPADNSNSDFCLSDEIEEVNDYELDNNVHQATKEKVIRVSKFKEFIKRLKEVAHYSNCDGCMNLIENINKLAGKSLVE